jgi:hypothetical protein
MDENGNQEPDKNAGAKKKDEDDIMDEIEWSLKWFLI